MPIAFLGETDVIFRKCRIDYREVIQVKILSIVALLSSLALYALALLVKFGIVSAWETRPVSLIGIAGVNAVIAIAFGVLSLGKK